MEAVKNMMDVIEAFAVPGVMKLFAEELLYAISLKYDGRDDWFEYLFEAYLDCKQLAVEITTSVMS